MEKEVWKVGNWGNSIVSNIAPTKPAHTEQDYRNEIDYYGGYLIAESVPDDKLKLLVAAPEMFEVLQTIENDNNQVPEWLWNKIKAVIKKATE